MSFSQLGKRLSIYVLVIYQTIFYLLNLSVYLMYFEHRVIFACLCHHLMRFYRLVLTAGLLVQMYL